MSGRDFVIWSIEHDAWWRAGSLGYCETLAEAGTYTRDEAIEILRRANTVAVEEAMIPIEALRGANAITREVQS